MFGRHSLSLRQKQPSFRIAFTAHTTVGHFITRRMVVPNHNVAYLSRFIYRVIAYLQLYSLQRASNTLYIIQHAFRSCSTCEQRDLLRKVSVLCLSCVFVQLVPGLRGVLVLALLLWTWVRTRGGRRGAPVALRTKKFPPQYCSFGYPTECQLYPQKRDVSRGHLASNPPPDFCRQLGTPLERVVARTP